MSWNAHPDFEPGSWAVKDLPLCQVRFQDDARFPWLILLPRIEGAVELIDLSRDDHQRLMDDIVTASQAVRRLGEHLGQPVDKLNVAALGNITPQLHIHVIGRRHDDDAWPDPVWGAGSAAYYPADLATDVMAKLNDWLA